MKLNMLQENFNTALNMVKTCCAERCTLPIMKDVMFGVEQGGMITLTTGDLESVIQCQYGCKLIDEPFSFTIPCKFTAEMVDMLPNDLIELNYNQEKHIATFKCGRYTANLNTKDSADYPPVPKVSGQSIEVYDLADAVKKVKDLITEVKRWNDGREDTEGLLFDLEKGLIVATDRKRMKVAHINATAPGTKFRISKKAATMLLKFKDTVNITYQPKGDNYAAMVKFECGKTTIITLDLESRNKYPDYQSIIEKEENKNLVEVY